MDSFVWNIDPVIVHLGPIQLRYYGIIFASMLYIGFILWRRQMLRGGHPDAVADKFLIWGVIAVIAGSRLGHCLFYEPSKYLGDPLRMLKFWEGGLSSHGATIGLVIALVTFALKYKLSIIEVLDRFSMSAAVGAAAVRLGNFFNSEVVGRATDVAWAMRFPRFDCHSPAPCPASVPRHPSQLYEFALGLFVLLALYLADRFVGKERRPKGLLASLFLVLYFAGRFIVEFFKEYQGELIDPYKTITMGQVLSVVPFLAGVVMLGWTLKTRNHYVPPVKTAEAPKKKTGGKGKKR